MHLVSYLCRFSHIQRNERETLFEPRLNNYFFVFHVPNLSSKSWQYFLWAYWLHDGSSYGFLIKVFILLFTYPFMHLVSYSFTLSRIKRNRRETLFEPQLNKRFFVFHVPNLSSWQYYQWAYWLCEGSSYGFLIDIATHHK